MPTTVPNRPMNGAVEPTVARNARPVDSLELIEAWLRASELCIHSRSSIGPVSLLYCSAATRPSSTTWPSALFSSSYPAPSFTLVALQTVRPAAFLRLKLFRSSDTFVYANYPDHTG